MTKNSKKMYLYSEIFDDATVRTYVNSSEWIRVEHKKRKTIDIAYTIKARESNLTEYAASVILEFANRVAYKSLKMKIANSGNKRLIEILETHNLCINNPDAGNDSEYNDIYAVAVEKFTYLATYFADNSCELWNMREYVYKCLENYYYSRKSYDNDADISAIVCEDGMYCSELFDIDMNEFKIDCAKWIYKYFSQKKRMPADKIALTFIHIVINEYTVGETARILNTSHMNVSKYMSMIRNNLINIPELKEMYDNYYV